MLNELHEELKQLKWNDATGHADSQVDESLSNAEFSSTAAGVDVMSLTDDDSSCNSLTSADDAFYVCALISTLLIFLPP